MKHKIFILFFLGLFLCLSFSACESEQSVWRIGVSQCSDDAWRTQLNREIEREALFYPGVSLEFKSAHDDSQQQIKDIETLVNDGVDLLVVAPNEVSAITPVIEKIYQKGIPVVLVDRKIDSESYTAYVGADNYEMGYEIGQYIVNRLGGQGNVVELTGLSDSSPAMERHRGLKEALTESGHVNLLATVDAGWRLQDAEQVFDSVLTCYPEINLVFAQNDRMGVGARNVAVRRNRSKDMLFVGVDALPGKGHGVELVSDGLFDATFIYPTGGDCVMQVAMQILQHKPYKRVNLLSTALVNRENARIMLMQTQHIETLDGKIELLDKQLDDFLLRYSSQRMFLLACVVILILVCVLLVFVVRAFWTKKRMNAELSARKTQLEEQRDQLIELSRKLEEVTHAKLAFFTSVSHDFRTPLTLIADPVEQLKQSASLSKNDRYLLDLIEKNVTVLLRLINQTLDFRKFENGKLELHLSSFNLAQGLKDWTEAFRTLSYRKHIHFTVDVQEEANGKLYDVVADPEMMERITYNLLSNAFKFTADNGEIAVRLSAFRKDEKPWIRLEVADTGIGMPEEQLAHIFESFYQVDVHDSGSGIGLALVKAFVEMHHGKIRVDSKEHKGTTFIIDLPSEQEGVLNPQEKRANLLNNLKEGAVLAADQSEVHITYEEDAHTPDKEKETVLVIEDNADVRQYIRALLSGEYNILEAANGQEGVQQATKHVPDVIVCDVMMPVMDGLECCRILKSELQTSHIPVLMLTAYTLEEQKIKGYECGADSYISKPFSANLLKVRLHNLLENHRRVQNFFADKPAVQKEGLNQVDQGFISKLRQLIDEELGNSEVSVEDLGASLGLGRVQLYRKTKALTGYSPNELLRIARLKKAALLLSTSEKSISEVTYEVGFTSPSYFTKCYKEYFGESPTDFLKRKSNS